MQDFIKCHCTALPNMPLPTYTALRSLPLPPFPSEGPKTTASFLLPLVPLLFSLLLTSHFNIHNLSILFSTSNESREIKRFIKEKEFCCFARVEVSSPSIAFLGGKIYFSLLANQQCFNLLSITNTAFLLKNANIQ